ncbi:hypothetical protein [Leptospira noguchii]|uniref:Uncharacterized protein n=1 Tax=Leptospira noguchii TaxID=28182 RepID=A0AAE9GC22_9LEPT|nr:hypothetical protein [Leptospira noguchii]UOG57334.1 hypothetical protein MAL03_03975 [Leptospira noguchii]
MELNETLFTDRVWNSMKRFLRITFGTQQNAFYGSRLELNETLFTDRVWNSMKRFLRIAFGTQ